MGRFSGRMHVMGSQYAGSDMLGALFDNKNRRWPENKAGVPNNCVVLTADESGLTRSWARLYSDQC